MFPGEDHWRENNTCSYCGSANPDLFMYLIRNGIVELGPTDKNYKVYLKGEGVPIKFYFQHLSQEQQKEFVDMLNEKRLKIGYPGHFYVLPFFIR